MVLVSLFIADEKEEEYKLIVGFLRKEQQMLKKHSNTKVAWVYL